MIKKNFFIFILLSLFLVTGLLGQFEPPSADQDTIFIEGGEDNAGQLEKVINNDIDADSNRVNPNRVYKLEADRVHYIHQKIEVDSTAGTIHIVGEKGGTKPVIIPTTQGEEIPGEGDILGEFNSSLTMKNVYVQGMSTGGNNYTWLFRLEGVHRDLVVENCVFEFTYLGIFDLNLCYNYYNNKEINKEEELDITLRNNYFRDLDDGEEWWDSRVYQAKVPTDSIIIENNTVSNSGLTFHQQHYKTRFWFFNHNTLINSKNQPRLSSRVKEAYITNNLFVNCNWVGEDINTRTSSLGERPIVGIVSIDTTHWPIQDNPLSYGLEEFEVYVDNNIHYVSDLLDPYYNGEFNTKYDDTPVSNIEWHVEAPNKVQNTPPVFMNNKTRKIVREYDNIEKGTDNHINNTKTEIEDLKLDTPGIPKEEVRDSMVVWNQARWSAQEYSTFDAEDVNTINWNFGDMDPTTHPKISSVRDFDEDFSYGAEVTSTLDNNHIGALHWYPSEMESYDYETQLQTIKSSYNEYVQTRIDTDEQPDEFKLEQNYPNPFNPTTKISYTLNKPGKVKLTIYNVLGEKVKTLVNKKATSLNNSVKWNATNEAGQKVASGVYFYKIEAPTNTKMKKMMLLK